MITDDWCQFPRKVPSRYGKHIGAKALGGFAWLTACADEDYSISFTLAEAAKALALTQTEVKRSLSKLESLGLIKLVSRCPKLTYRLLWIPGEQREDDCPRIHQIPYSNERTIIINLSNDRCDSLHAIPSPYPMDFPNNTLAQEIADTLDDQDALPLYQSFTRRYSEKYLRQKLIKVMSISSDKIKKTRGALFTFLVQRNHDR